MEKEKEEIICKGFLFCGGEGKGGKYLGKDNTFFVEEKEKGGGYDEEVKIVAGRLNGRTCNEGFTRGTRGPKNI